MIERFTDRETLEYYNLLKIARIELKNINCQNKGIFSVLKIIQVELKYVNSQNKCIFTSFQVFIYTFLALEIKFMINKYFILITKHLCAYFHRQNTVC